MKRRKVKTKLRIIKTLNKLIEENTNLKRQRDYLIKCCKSHTYGGIPLSPPGHSFRTWEEAAEIEGLSENKRKEYPKNMMEEVWDLLDNNKL